MHVSDVDSDALLGIKPLLAGPIEGRGSYVVSLATTVDQVLLVVAQRRVNANGAEWVESSYAAPKERDRIAVLVIPLPDGVAGPGGRLVLSAPTATVLHECGTGGKGSPLPQDAGVAVLDASFESDDLCLDLA